MVPIKPEQPFDPFVGVHCETVATGSLLKAAGVELSEPMLFGLGEGLSFVLLNLSSLPLPFVGGRPKPFELTQRLCRNLGIDCHSSETVSRPKAWQQLEVALGQRIPVGLQLDCFYLDYFEKPPHFAGHFVAAYALDGDEVKLVDTVQQGTLQIVSRASLEAARHAKGPMSSRARMYTVEVNRNVASFEGAVRTAIRANAERYLRPLFSGMGVPGIEKLAKSLPTWLQKSQSPRSDLQLASDLMERAGTGGALFRNLYRDFLTEAIDVLTQSESVITEARDRFDAAASKWTSIATHLEWAGAQGRADCLLDAANDCREIAAIELSAMQILAGL
jgi:Domain of unknown function (DUF4872)/Butirosin biosynthesis protein H, N-terminal